MVLFYLGKTICLPNLSASTPNIDFVVKKQYLTYDIDSLIADVGEYLGLILGHSMLTFYDSIIPVVRKLTMIVFEVFLNERLHFSPPIKAGHLQNTHK
jgi:hypothetical protein